MDCDLHIHTVNSDGSMSVKDVIYYASKSGLKNIAITDHDTMSGVEEAVDFGNSIGLMVIPAVEITAVDTKRNRPVHVLCYFPKNIAVLEKFLQRTLDYRRNQKLEMIEKVQKLYPLLELDHILRYAKYSQSIYESHIMQALCDLGHTNTAIGTLMEELITKKGSCYVPSNYPSIDQLLEVLKEVNAFVVIAHPEEFNSFDLAKELAIRGEINGLEYDHPRNGAPSREIITQIADEYNLILTGGSDFHGQYAKKANPLGSYGCNENVIFQMKHIIAEKGI